jgi:hypothetical protein
MSNGLAIEPVPVVSPIRTSTSLSKILPAMIASAKEYPPFAKDTKSYTNKYTRLESIQSSVTPILLDNDILIMQPPTGMTPGVVIKKIIEVGESAEIRDVTAVQFKIGLTTRLQHISGEYIEATAYMPLPLGKSVNISQQAGIAISYMRRYMLAAILNLIIHGEDFDGATPKGTDPKKKENKGSPPPENKNQQPGDAYKKLQSEIIVLVNTKVNEKYVYDEKVRAEKKTKILNTNYSFAKLVEFKGIVLAYVNAKKSEAING